MRAIGTARTRDSQGSARVPRSRRAVSALAVIALAGGLVALTAAPAEAASLVVTSDSPFAIAGDSQCTLPEAVANADADADTSGGDCVAGSGADVITFAPAVTSIVLDAPLPTVTDGAGLTILGSARVPTISGGNLNRPFTVIASGTLTLQDVAVVNGSDGGSGGDGGGAILNDGTVRVIDARLADHLGERGGAILNRATGTLVVEDSTLDGNSATYDGGAIMNSGTMTLTGSTFASNDAGVSGGAVSTDGVVTVTDSTFEQNSSNGAGGAMLVGGFVGSISGSTFVDNVSGLNGGAIYNDNPRLRVDRSTFAANVADLRGGGIYVKAELVVDRSTFHGNSAAAGGGIGSFNTGGRATIRNSSFAENSATTVGASLNEGYETWVVSGSVFAAEAGKSNCDLPVDDAGGNIDSGSSCGFSAPAGAAWGSNVDALLGPLADNGGTTPTMLPGAGSPALDAIAPGELSCPSATPAPSDLLTDQRGVIRPQGAACDIGAVEVEADPVAYTVSPFGSPVTNLPGSTKLKAGDRLPLKFAVTDASGTPVTNLAGGDVAISVELATCSGGALVVDLEFPAGAALQLRPDGTYQVDLKTQKSWSGLCGTVAVTTPFGGERAANVEFTGGGRGKG
ncbi:choice-of-anchor Q domain-containing protein [Agromyces sp. M3QZ16-3]|uniref:choice-of-anchor Q domain-containing protein n=1 Tax=Agromyces sp. M3QZ16-3 TaxID=3447585 RepID=UPI003F68C8CE